MSAVLAFSDQVISGLVEFSGPVRSRLVAYLVLGCAGAASGRTLRLLLHRDPGRHHEHPDLRHAQPILEMLSQAPGSGVPMTVLPEHLGGFTR
jgi:hypothetical protein